MTTQDESDNQYRDLIEKGAQKSQSDYDKAVLTLSGGALGVSIAFVKDIVGKDAHHSYYLTAAWLLWGVSCAAVLLSYYSSAVAHRKESADFVARPAADRSFSFADFLTHVLNV